MNRLIFGIIILVFLSCGHSKKDLVVVEFKSIGNCDENGIPRDSLFKYYPIELYQDTIPGFFNGHDIIRFSEMGKRRYAHNFDIDIRTLKDTFEIEMRDTSDLRMYSYMYFKMNEPVLYSHYLKRDVYRLTSIRSGYHSPLVITFEKYRDSVVLITKELNRRIDYPFIKNSGPVIFVESNKSSKSDRKIEEQRLELEKRLNDSISKVYRNCNYHLVLNKRIKISKAVWDSLVILVDSAKLWKSKPELDLSKTEDDDSRMIFEGHSKNGYQIRMIPSLHLYNRRYTQGHSDNFDSKNSFTKIFKFISRHTNLKDEDIY